MITLTFFFHFFDDCNTKSPFLQYFFSSLQINSAHKSIKFMAFYTFSLKELKIQINLDVEKSFDF